MARRGPASPNSRGFVYVCPIGFLLLAEESISLSSIRVRTVGVTHRRHKSHRCAGSLAGAKAQIMTLYCLPGSLRNCRNVSKLSASIREARKRAGGKRCDAAAGKFAASLAHHPASSSPDELFRRFGEFLSRSEIISRSAMRMRPLY